MTFYANATILSTTQVTPADGVVPSSVTFGYKLSGAGAYTAASVTLVGQVSTNPPTWAYKATWTPTSAGTYVRKWASASMDGRDYGTVAVEAEP